MKITLILLLGLVNVAAVAVVVLNRSSEKIVTSYISIAIGAVGAIALSIAAFADQATISHRFPVAFFIDPTDRRQIGVSARSDIYPGNDAEQHATILCTPEDPMCGKAYHRALQRVVIEWMIRTYWHTWRIESIHYDTPGFWEMRTGPIEGADDAATVLTLGQITRQFSASPPRAFSQNIDKIALPPGLFGRRAKLMVKEPYHDAQLGETGNLAIENDFLELKLITRPLGFRQGLGEYGPIAGVTDEEDRAYGHFLHEVIATVTFKAWLGGHPEMPKYRRWATSLIEMMRDTFDEQRVLQRSRDAAAHPKVLRSTERHHIPAVFKLQRAAPKENP